MNGAGGSPKDRVALSMINMVHLEHFSTRPFPDMIIIIFSEMKGVCLGRRTGPVDAALGRYHL